LKGGSFNHFRTKQISQRKLNTRMWRALRKVNTFKEAKLLNRNKSQLTETEGKLKKCGSKRKEP